MTGVSVDVFATSCFMRRVQSASQGSLVSFRLPFWHVAFTQRLHDRFRAVEGVASRYPAMGGEGVAFFCRGLPAGAACANAHSVMRSSGLEFFFL